MLWQQSILFVSASHRHGCIAILSHSVTFIQELPKTATGKIQKCTLRFPPIQTPFLGAESHGFEKVAVAVVEASTVTEQVLLLPVQAPLQPANVEPAPARARSFTTGPLA